MSQYRIVIRSTSPSSAWIRRFVQEIAARGGDIRQIAFYGLFDEDLKRSHEEARQMMVAAEKEAICILQLLLHPQQHKHYLRAVAGLHKALLDDSRVLLVYDLQDIREIVINRQPEMVVDLMAVQSILEELGKSFDAKRILERRNAVGTLANIIPFP